MISKNMAIEFGLFLAGIGIATVAMAIGIGGGILWTPLLILAYHTSPQEAVATSLMIQVVGMGSGTVAYLRAKLVEKKLMLIIFLAALPGVVLGSLIAVKLPEDPVQLALGAMALTLALVFISGREEVERQGFYSYDRKKVIQILPVPAFFGLVMGFLSVGVGEWILPALKSKLKLEMNRAVATVIPVMFLLALVGSVSHGLLSKNIHWAYFFWGALGTLFGGQIGPRVAVKVSDKLLKEIFVYVMTLIGIHLIFHAI